MVGVWPMGSVAGFFLARSNLKCRPPPGFVSALPLEARKGLELFQLCDHLPVAKGVLQEVTATPLVNEKLKRLTRRQRALVNERNRLLSRMQADLQAVCPGLLGSPRMPTMSGFSTS